MALDKPKAPTVDTDPKQATEADDQNLTWHQIRIDFWRGLFVTAADAYEVAEKNGNPTWQQAVTLNQTRQQYTNAMKANGLQ